MRLYFLRLASTGSRREELVYFLAGSALSALLGFVTVPILSFSASAGDIGRYGLLRSLSFMVGLGATLGAEHAYLREYNEVANRSILARQALRISAGTSSVVLFAWFVLGHRIVPLVFDATPTLNLLVAVGVTLVAQINLRIQTVVLRAQGRGRAFAASSVSLSIVLVLGVTTAQLTGVSLNFPFLADLLAFGVLTQLLVAACATRAFPMLRLRESGREHLVGQMVRFGLPVTVSSLAYWFLDAGDRLLLSSLRDTSELGVYTVAGSVAAATALLSQTFNTVWAPIGYVWAAAPGGVKRIGSLNHRLSIVSGMVPVFAYFAAGFAKYLLPEDYWRVQSMVPSLALGVICFSVSETTVLGINVARKTKLVLAISIVCVVVNVGINLLLIPKHGAEGAAATTAISSILLLVLRSEGARHVFTPLGARSHYLFPFGGCVFSLLVAFFDVSPRHATIISISWLLFSLLALAGTRTKGGLFLSGWTET